MLVLRGLAWLFRMNQSVEMSGSEHLTILGTGVLSRPVRREGFDIYCAYIRVVNAATGTRFPFGNRGKIKVDM